MDNYIIVSQILSECEASIAEGVWDESLAHIVANSYALFITFSSVTEIKSVKGRIDSCLVKAVNTNILGQNRYISLCNYVSAQCSEAINAHSIVTRAAQYIASLYTTDLGTTGINPYSNGGIRVLFLLLDYGKKLHASFSTPEFKHYTYLALRENAEKAIGVIEESDLLEKEIISILLFACNAGILSADDTITLRQLVLAHNFSAFLSAIDATFEEDNCDDGASAATELFRGDDR